MHDALIIAVTLLSLASSMTCQDAQANSAVIVAHLEWEPGTVGASAPRRVALGAEPPAGVKLPAGISNPHFGSLSIAGGRMAVALDANPGSPRLWIDRDFDGDLAEEKTTRLSRERHGFARTQIVLAPYDGEAEPAPLQLHWTCDVAGAAPRLSVRLLVHRRGTIVLSGRLRLVAVTDGNGDGRFDDEKADKIYLDINGDGALQFGSTNGERIRPGEPFRVGEEGWTVRVASASGHAIEFERSDKVPPAVARSWPVSQRRPVAGTKRNPPQQSLAELKERFTSEQSKSPAQRYATINLIGSVGSAAAFDALTEIAGAAKDNATRSSALRALGNAAFLATRKEPFAALARNADGQSAQAIAQALYYAGHPDRDAIYAEMLASSDYALVMAAVRWLAYSDSEQATSSILAAVEKGSMPAVRRAAYVYGARNLPNGPPIDTVLRAARDDDATLRAQAIKDLGVLGHPDAVRLALVEAAKRPVAVATGKVVCEVLGAAGTKDSVAAILGLLDDDSLHANVRKEVVTQLRLVRTKEGSDLLIKALRSKRPSVRAVAAEILSDLPERRVTEALLTRAKKEKDKEVLPLLLEALGDHGDPIALSTLRSRTRHRQPEVRMAAVRALARLGFHHDKVRAFFLSMLESSEWVDRVLALDAAKAAGGVKLLPKVVKSLNHRKWQVRLAAVETLGALRAREGVLPLIERLDGEEERRVRDTIARVLFELTGVNCSDNLKTWRLWWSENGKTFAVPDEVPVLPDRSAGRTSAGFYGIPIVSERIVFLIDQSGSMSAIGEQKEHYAEKSLNRLEVAVRETLGALAKLGDRAKVNVILFHSTIHPWEEQMKRLGPNRKKLKSKLESQRPMGGTNIYDGLELALRMKDVDTIFLLSDGSPGQGKFVATPDILRAIRRENQTRRIAIHCVAVGMDSELLRKLAAQNGGNYVRR